MKKTCLVILLVLALGVSNVWTGHLQAAQKRIEQVDLMPNLPHPLEMRDWAQVAREYDQLIFDFEQSGKYLPLIEWDRSQPNVALDTFFLPSYVGDTRQRPGAQEAINTLAAVVGASLVGIDKSNQEGLNWVLMQKQYFNYATRQNQVLNNTQTHTGGSFWYEIFPAMLFFMLVDQYPEVAQITTPLRDGSNAVTMEDIMYFTTEGYLDVIEALKQAGGDTRQDFPWNSYRLDTNSLVINGQWYEPDALAGIAWMSYMTYQKFGEERFLDAALWALGYLERQGGNPFYEVLLPYGTTLAARINAEQGTTFDVTKLTEWAFAPSKARPGWGVVTEAWGNVDVHGLQGSLTDGEGYAFAMNTFQIAAALVPLVRYEPKYATDIGKWVLNLANNARLFYPGYSPEDRQSSPEWEVESRNLVTYEGLRKQWQGRSPYVTGDGLPANLAETDYALYGASHVGFLGAMIDFTNQQGILQIDLLATDHFGAPSYPSYLFYNPYNEMREIRIDVGNDPIDVYDLVSKEFIVLKATGEVMVSVPATSAIVTVLVPSGGKVEYQENKMLVDGIVVDYQRNQVEIVYPHNKRRISNKVLIELDLMLSPGFTYQHVEVSMGEDFLYQGDVWPAQGLVFDSELFADGDYDLVVTLHAEEVILQDKVNVTINNGILGAVYGEDLANWSPVPDAVAAIQTRGTMISFVHDLPDVPWVGVQSPVLSIDFERNPLLVIKGVRSRGPWFVRLIVARENGETQHSVIESDGAQAGRLEFNLGALIPDLPSSTVSCQIMFGIQGLNNQLSLFRDSVDIYYLEAK